MSDPVVLPLGLDAVLRVRAVPRTRLTLDQANLREVTALSHRVRISGSCEGLPDQTPCRVSWLVEKGGEQTAVSAGTIPLSVTGSSCALEVELGVIGCDLFGQGTIGYSVQPDFPHCDGYVRQPGAITFDARPTLEVVEGTTGKRIGTRVTLRPGLGRLCAGLLRLEVREKDEGQDEVASTTDMARAFTWIGQDRRWRPAGVARDGSWVASGDDPLRWRIGCHDLSGTRFDYPEENEAGAHYEYEHQLKLSADGGETWQTLTQPQHLLSVERPRLVSFQLTSEKRAFLGGLIGGVRLAIKANGQISGFDPGLDPSVHVELWSSGWSDGTMRPVGAASGIDVLDNEGRFSLELCELEGIERVADWESANSGRKLVGILQVPGAPGVPVARVMRYDADANPPCSTTPAVPPYYAPTARVVDEASGTAVATWSIS